MQSDGKIVFQIPSEKINDFIITRLIEIESQNRLLIDMASRLLFHSDEDKSLESVNRFVNDINDQMRNKRLEVIADLIKQYS